MYNFQTKQMKNLIFKTTSDTISFYFSNKKQHYNFKNKMINTPTSYGQIEMFDFFGKSFFFPKIILKLLKNFYY